MKVITTNLLNRFWKNGVLPIKTALAGKLEKSKGANNLLTTEEGFWLDARQGKALDDKITELNSNITVSEHDKSVINFKSAWEIRHCEVYKTGRHIQVSARIYTGTIVKNHEYTIATVNSEFRPLAESPLCAIAGDYNMDNTVICMCVARPNGDILLKVPGDSKTYVDISGSYIV